MALSHHQTGWRRSAPPAGPLRAGGARVALAAGAICLALVAACSAEEQAPPPVTAQPVTVSELMANAFTWDRTTPVVRDPDRDPDAALAYLATRALAPDAAPEGVAALSLPRESAGSAELALAVRRHGGPGAGTQASRLLESVTPDGLAAQSVAAGALALAGDAAAQPWCDALRGDAPSSSRVALALSSCGLAPPPPSGDVPALATDADDTAAESVYDLAFGSDEGARDRATAEARSFLEAVNAGSARPSDRALTQLALAAGQQPSGAVSVRLRQIELFAGTLPEQAVPDAFGQVMALRAWRSVGGPPSGVEEVFAEALEPVAAAAPAVTVATAISHTGLGKGLPPATSIAPGADEDPITAYGLTAAVAGEGGCAAVSALRPPLPELRTAVQKPMAVAPNRTVMLALGAGLERECGQPEVATVVAGLVEKQLSDTSGASDQPYRLWGELEARCVLDGELSQAERDRATTVAGTYLTEVVQQPATRFGVGDVYGATRLQELARGCDGAWWQSD